MKHTVYHVFSELSNNCPKCDSLPSEHEVREYDMMWHDGDVYCRKCGSYVRMYDAG